MKKIKKFMVKMRSCLAEKIIIALMGNTSSKQILRIQNARVRLNTKIVSHIIRVVVSTIFFLSAIVLSLDIIIRKLVEIINIPDSILISILLVMVGLSIFFIKSIIKYLIDFFCLPEFNTKDIVLVSIVLFAIPYNLMPLEEQIHWNIVLKAVILLLMFYTIKFFLIYKIARRHAETLGDYAHNLIRLGETPDGKGKAKGFYVYCDKTDKIVRVLIVHGNNCRETLNLTEILENEVKKVLLDRIVWPEDSDRATLLDKEIAEAILLNCKFVKRNRVNDLPISNRYDDCLGVSERVVQPILRLMQSNSIKPCVIALTGAWGSGKTSTLNLLRKRLEEMTGIFLLNLSHYWKENMIFKL